jgi:amino acid adenylation domain-containing protein
VRQGEAHAQLLCLVVHHVVIDPVGMDLLVNEITAGYAAHAGTGGPPSLPEPVPAPPVLARDDSLRYWREHLAGFDPSGMRLAVGREPVGPATFAAEEIVHRYPAEFAAQLRSLRTVSRSTDAAILLTAYLLALTGLGAATDAVVGVLSNTRGTTRATGLAYRTATLPLRVSVEPDTPFTELVATVSARLWSALEHADVSFETLAPDLLPDRDDPLWWRSGLLRHVFNHRFTPAGTAGEEAATGTLGPVHTGLSRFDLELTIQQVGDVYIARLTYSSEVHDEPFAVALLERIDAILAQACAAPQRPVRRLDLRTPAERALGERVNRTSVTWPGPDTVPALVARAAAADPAAVAVVDGPRRCTYAELMRRAAGVRALLDRNGVRPGEVVALAAPRGTELAAGALGVWSAGAAYLPVDADQPAPWLHEQLSDAGVRLVLDGQRLPPGAAPGAALLPLSTVDQPADPPGPLPVDPAALAYLIYTSGSTGRPKGVRITHGNLHNLIRHFAGLLDAGTGTGMLWLTTFAFDISALELFLPLSCGGRVVVGPDEVRSVPRRLAALVRAEDVGIVQATPTTWRAALGEPADWLAGRTVLCGGEPLPAAVAYRLRDTDCRAFNVYGPTETTIWSTVADLADEEPARVTVGQPIANTQVHVLDDAGRPVPVGVAGELCLGGAGVAEGYHGQPELTARRFPTGEALGVLGSAKDQLRLRSPGEALGRYYRTGDLARMRPDGRLELLGRRDRQVKLRGHRIELGEIEHALAAHPEVRAAAVLLCEPAGSDGYLAGFVVADDRPGLVEDVWEFARSRLPSHRLPSRIAVLDELPQTANAKVDLLSLHRSGVAYDPSAGPAVAASADPLEQRLLDEWRAVLDRPALDPHANFFLSGGTSLQAALIAERISQWCSVPVPMIMIFQAPSPAALAGLVRSRQA